MLSDCYQSTIAQLRPLKQPPYFLPKLNVNPPPVLAPPAAPFCPAAPLPPAPPPNVKAGLAGCALPPAAAGAPLEAAPNEKGVDGLGALEVLLDGAPNEKEGTDGAGADDGALAPPPLEDDPNEKPLLGLAAVELPPSSFLGAPNEKGVDAACAVVALLLVGGAPKLNGAGDDLLATALEEGGADAWVDGAPKLKGAAPPLPLPDVAGAEVGASVFGPPKEKGTGDGLLSVGFEGGGPKEKGELLP